MEFLPEARAGISSSTRRVAVKVKSPLACVPIPLQFQCRQPPLARAQREVLGGIRARFLQLLKGPQLVLLGSDLVEKVEEGASNGDGEELLQPGEVA